MAKVRKSCIAALRILRRPVWVECLISKLKRGDGNG